MHATYNYIIVGLSIGVGVIASFITLQLVLRSAETEGKESLFWFGASSFCFGLGVWSTHLVGMLSLRLPVPVFYDISLLLLSALVAAISSGMAFFMLRHNKSKLSIGWASVFLGLGIAGMHYLGMAAIPIHTHVKLGYNLWLVLLSIAVAISASYIGLYKVYNVSSKGAFSFRTSTVGAISLGVAISGMHYTGIKAGVFDFHVGSTLRENSGRVVASNTLLLLVFTSTILLLALALVLSYADRIMKNTKAEAEAVKRLYEEVQSLNLAKSSFFAVISHELRTPLTAIMGYSELLETGVVGPVSPEQEDMLQKIQNSSQQLLSIIEQVLEFSAMEVNREILSKEVFDVVGIVRYTLDMIRPLVERKQLTMTFLPEAEEILIESDPSKVKQILLNLVGNAVKFTEQGSITVRTYMRKHNFCIEVQDTGMGIPEQAHENIFQPFWRVEQALTRKTAGTGLGLSVTKSAIEKLGGSIQVKSRLGEGALFIVTLPRGVYKE